MCKNAFKVLTMQKILLWNKRYVKVNNILGHFWILIELTIMVGFSHIFESLFLSLPWWLRWWSICPQCERPGFHPWVGKISWRRKWQLTPVLLPGESHGRRRDGYHGLVGYSPWDRKESDTTERLHFHLYFHFESLRKFFPYTHT